MAGNVWGADVAQLRTLAQQFGTASDSLIQQSTSLTGVINNNGGSWKGADSARFKSEWNGSHRALIQQTADALKQESKRLLANADEQEKASQDGAAGSSRTKDIGPTGFAAGAVLLGAVGGLKAGMTMQKYIKAPITLAKHVGQYGWVLKNRRAELAQALLTKGRHRLGGPLFDGRHLVGNTAGNTALDDLLRESAKANRGLGLIDKASDIASLRNLDKYVGPLSRAEGFFAEKPWVGAGTKFEWLGKSGLARGLGWAGVGFSTVDSVRSFANGDIQGGVGNALKAGLGVGCFLPPPAGTVCQVASVGIAVYENWDTISSVGKNVGEGIANAVKDPGKFVSDAGNTLKDAGKSVAKFLSFGG